MSLFFISYIVSVFILNTVEVSNYEVIVSTNNLCKLKTYASDLNAFSFVLFFCSWLGVIMKVNNLNMVKSGTWL